MSAIVELREVTKRFGERLAVDGVNLAVPAGMCFGLLGPNGAGKTTALRMIYGVTRPSAGSIHVFGIDIGEHPREVRARLGVTLQENVMTDEISPRDNLRTFGRFHLLREPDLSSRVDELIDFLELRSHADVPVRFLSGGFKRRLAIAQSLMNRPELLILDEPTTGLDPAVRLSVWSRVRELQTRGATVLLTTHYMDEAQRLCDRLAIMAEGKIRDEGSPNELIRKHLAKEAVELDCSEEEQARILDGFLPRLQKLRVERRLMIYLDDAAPLIERIRVHDHGDRRALVVRPTNLEDVFITLTGGRLEGEA